MLDEAHCIKDRRCNTAQSAFALQARYRWCLTGTPLQNRVNELYSLIRFLRLHPFSHYFADKTKCCSLDFPFKNDLRRCDLCGVCLLAKGPPAILLFTLRFPCTVVYRSDAERSGCVVLGQAIYICHYSGESRLLGVSGPVDHVGVACA